MAMSMVSDNKEKYTQNDFLQAVRVYELQVTLRRPSTKDLICIIEGNMIPNCPVTTVNNKAAEFIFGPDLGC